MDELTNQISNSQTLAVRASGVTINVRPDGTIEIYISQSRYDWRAMPVGRNYEVIVIKPKEQDISNAITTRDK